MSIGIPTGNIEYIDISEKDRVSPCEFKRLFKELKDLELALKDSYQRRFKLINRLHQIDSSITYKYRSFYSVHSDKDKVQDGVGDLEREKKNLSLEFRNFSESLSPTDKALHERVTEIYNTLINSNMGMLVGVASKFKNSRLGYEGAFSEGLFVLYDCIRNFNPDLDFTFNTYARGTLFRELGRINGKLRDRSPFYVDHRLLNKLHSAPAKVEIDRKAGLRSFGILGLSDEDLEKIEDDDVVEFFQFINSKFEEVLSEKEKQVTDLVDKGAILSDVAMAICENDEKPVTKEAIRVANSKALNKLILSFFEHKGILEFSSEEREKIAAMIKLEAKDTKKFLDIVNHRKLGMGSYQKMIRSIYYKKLGLYFGLA